MYIYTKQEKTKDQTYTNSVPLTTPHPNKQSNEFTPGYT